ncbi:MAG: hypothetical protein CVU65_02375 [Deltaproteobacteria bacterium HGW-Deltaproteobacteria-22]|nr:MAG: hypothetical protein CVU65_02375 [Deltaproteobacteria bacterium HGW-Deltaproteobacteria-22]
MNPEKHASGHGVFPVDFLRFGTTRDKMSPDRGNDSMRKVLLTALFPFLFSCRTPDPAPEPVSDPVKTPAPAVAAAPRIDPLRMIPLLDQCPRDSTPCKPINDMDQALRAMPRDERFALLKQLLDHSSAPVQSYALTRLYPHRHRTDLLPRLEELMSASTDAAVLKMAATLLLLQDTGQAATAFCRHFGNLPREVKQSMIWALRMNYAHLPLPFLESLKEDPVPLVRAAALEIEAVHLTDLEALSECIRQLRPEAGSCALAIARTSNARAREVLEVLAAHFEDLARTQKRLVRIPPELATAVELLHGQKRMDKAAATELLVRLLGNRRLEDEIRAQAALSLGVVGGREALPVLSRHRKDSRKKVGYAARRAMYFLEREPE